MKKLIIINMLFLFIVSVGFGQRMKERIAAQKVAFFTDKLDLTVEESKQFWPIYNEYEQKLKTLRKTGRKTDKKIVKNLTDKEIEVFIEQQFKRKEAAIKLERNLVKQLRRVMPLQKIVQLPRIQKQFRKWLLEQRKDIMNRRQRRRR